MKGRGHTKEKPLLTKIADEHGQPVIRLSRKLFDLGLKLNQEVQIFPSGDNPLNWEITIVPVNKKREES